MVNKVLFLQEELQNKSPLCWKQWLYARGAGGNGSLAEIFGAT